MPTLWTLFSPLVDLSFFLVCVLATLVLLVSNILDLGSFDCSYAAVSATRYFVKISSCKPSWLHHNPGGNVKRILERYIWSLFMGLRIPCDLFFQYRRMQVVAIAAQTKQEREREVSNIPLPSPCSKFELSMSPSKW